MEGFKVIHVLYSGLGGHGNVVFSLLQTNFNSKHENVLVFYGIEAARKEYIEQAGALGIKTYSILKKQKRYLKSFKAFKEILKNEAPQRVIVHSSELIIPATRYCKKNKNCRTYYGEHENNRTKTRFAHGLSQYAAKYAHKTICLNAPYKDELNQRYNKPNQFVVIPNGINELRFKPQPNDSKTVTLGMAARINKTKDHFTLLEAFKKCLKTTPNIVLQIAGDGDLLPALKKHCQALDLEKEVQFLGLLGEDDLIRFYQSLTLCVHATKSETLSTAILQAMACELPIITSSIANNKLLITNQETGWLYEVENVVDLADKINWALANPKEGLTLAKNAHAHVLENYTSNSMAKKYDALICEK